MKEFRQGRTARLDHIYVDVAASPAVPTTPKISIYNPDGTIFESLEDKVPTAGTGTGAYYYEFSIPADATVQKGYFALWKAANLPDPPQPQLFEIIAATAIPHYADVSAAAELAGIEEYQILGAMLDEADRQIDDALDGEDFQRHTVTEYYDILTSYIDKILLDHHTGVVVTEILDDAQSDTPITLDSSAYIVDPGPGAVILNPTAINLALSQTKQYFTKGSRSVKVTYTYGYTEIPDLVRRVATLIVARIALLLKQSDEATVSGLPSGGIDSLRMGDFAVSFSGAEEKFKTKFDDDIKDGIKLIKARYGKGVLAAAGGRGGIT